MLPLQGTLVRELRYLKLRGMAKDLKNKYIKIKHKLNDMISVFLGSMESYVRNCSSQMPAGGGGGGREGNTL